MSPERLLADAPEPPRPPVKGGTAATLTVVGLTTFIGWLVGKFAEIYPTPWLGSPTDQAVVSGFLNAIVGVPAGLFVAWIQHKKERVLRELEND